jgi:hypothetical protein
MDRELRRYRKIIVVLISMIVAMVSMGQTKSQDNIVCKSLVVVDDNGKAGVAIEASADGGLLAVFGPKGEISTAISQSDEGNGTVTTYSTSGQELVDLISSENGDGVILTHSKTGKEIVEVGANEYGGRITVFHAAIGKASSLYATKDGMGTLELKTRKGFRGISD